MQGPVPLSRSLISESLPGGLHLIDKTKERGLCYERPDNDWKTVCNNCDIDILDCPASTIRFRVIACLRDKGQGWALNSRCPVPKTFRCIGPGKLRAHRRRIKSRPMGRFQFEALAGYGIRVLNSIRCDTGRFSTCLFHRRFWSQGAVAVRSAGKAVAWQIRTWLPDESKLLRVQRLQFLTNN